MSDRDPYSSLSSAVSRRHGRRLSVTSRHPFAFAVKAIFLRALAHMDDGDVRGVLEDTLLAESMFGLRFQPRQLRSRSPLSAVAARIRQLGGTTMPGPEPETIRAMHAHRRSQNLYQGLAEDLMSILMAGESYAEISRWLATRDPASQELVDDLLARRRRHARELEGLLDQSLPSGLQSVSGE